MPRKIILVSIAACSLVAVAAWAAPHMQPGLWTYTTTMDLGQAMPKLPPQALAMMKARGMNIPVPGQPVVTQVCITPQQASMDRPPATMQQETGCTMQNVRQSANTYSADIVCKGTRMQGSGHTDVSYNGSTHMQAQSTFRGTAGGRPMNTSSKYSADFVSANCGSVKPFQMPPTPPGTR